jgi:hypothetical protein
VSPARLAHPPAASPARRRRGLAVSRGWLSRPAESPEDLTWSAHFVKKTGVSCRWLASNHVRRFCNQG